MCAECSDVEPEMKYMMINNKQTPLCKENAIQKEIDNFVLYYDNIVSSNRKSIPYKT